MEIKSNLEILSPENFSVSLVDPTGESYELVAAAALGVYVAYKIIDQAAKFLNVVQKVDNAHQAINQNPNQEQRILKNLELTGHGLQAAHTPVIETAKETYNTFNTIPKVVSGEGAIDAVKDIIDPKAILYNATTNVNETAPESHDTVPNEFDGFINNLELHQND